MKGEIRYIPGSAVTSFWEDTSRRDIFFFLLLQYLFGLNAKRSKTHTPAKKKKKISAPSGNNYKGVMS